VDGSLKTYKHFRKYTDNEISSEQDEYFDNDHTKKIVPGLFKDKDDLTRWIKDSKLELLDGEEISKMYNSDAGEVLSQETPSQKLKTAAKLAKHYGKDYLSLLQAFKNNWKLPPPLIIRDKSNQLYLMAGNTRMMIALALGYNMPVKIVKYGQELKTEGIDTGKDVLINIAKWIVKKHGLRSKVRFSRSTATRGNYLWVEDIIMVENNPKNMLDFIETVLHEVDHALMRKKMGAVKYEEVYTIGGQRAVNKGKDFHDDNPLEIQAEKYAKKNAKNWLKKIKITDFTT